VQSLPPVPPAVIRNSGSTNTRAYTIVVYPDGAADVTVGDATGHRRVAHPQTAWLFAKLEAAMPLTALPAARCMRSISFGTSTTIAFRGERTPDLNCAADPASQELARTTRVIVEQLGISVLRPLTIPPH
jgi:hypothetical protein